MKLTIKNKINEVSSAPSATIQKQVQELDHRLAALHEQLIFEKFSFEAVKQYLFDLGIKEQVIESKIKPDENGQCSIFDVMKFWINLY